MRIQLSLDKKSVWQKLLKIYALGDFKKIRT